MEERKKKNPHQTLRLQHNAAAQYRLPASGGGGGRHVGLVYDGGWVLFFTFFYQRMRSHQLLLTQVIKHKNLSLPPQMQTAVATLPHHTFTLNSLLRETNVSINNRQPPERSSHGGQSTGSSGAYILYTRALEHCLLHSLQRPRASLVVSISQVLFWAMMVISFDVSYFFVGLFLLYFSPIFPFIFSVVFVVVVVNVQWCDLTASAATTGVLGRCR